jgi:organic hydroperoxide reductase OsmC/OhrA
MGGSCRLFHYAVRQTTQHGELRAGAGRQQIGVVINTDGDGFSITSVHLTVTARIPGIDQDAAKAKAGCPVFKLIKVEIAFEATLSP